MPPEQAEVMAATKATRASLVDWLSIGSNRALTLTARMMPSPGLRDVAVFFYTPAAERWRGDFSRAVVSRAVVDERNFSS